MSLLKKSFTIGNHRTSISLEPEFWDALEIKANEQDISLSKLDLKIDKQSLDQIQSTIDKWPWEENTAKYKMSKYLRYLAIPDFITN